MGPFTYGTTVGLLGGGHTSSTVLDLLGHEDERLVLWAGLGRGVKVPLVVFQRVFYTQG